MAPSEIGNTKQFPRIVASLNWCFTLNNYTKEELTILEDEVKTYGSNFRLQSEVGESGTPHIQGFITLKKKGRPMESFTNKRIHWEKCRNIKAARDYCCKEETHDGVYELDSEEKLDLIKPHGWMLDVLSILEEKPDYRKIYWYWEANGNTGKSAFCKYLCAKKKALCVSGKSNDCKYAIIGYKEEHSVYPKIIIFDVPRTNIEYLNYEAIESIKNGCFFCGKYESKQVIMNCPHIIIFANREPDRYKLSEDRLIITKIEPH